MGLSISIALGSPVPVYRQIVDQICAAVASGKLKENESLPTIRMLAEELQINPNTVVKAYADLAREGVVESRGMRGTFIAPRRKVGSRAERRRRIAPALKAFISEALLLGFTPEEIVAEVEEMAEKLSPM